jgi:hypothetical protein
LVEVGLTASVVSTVVLLGLVGIASAQTLEQRSAE